MYFICTIIGLIIGIWLVCAVISLGKPTASREKIIMLITESACFYGLIGFVLDIGIHLCIYFVANSDT